jgi:nucleoside-triphosphatase THEP1
MEAPQKLGYDAPRVRQVEDSLDRWRFASELMGLIRNTPPEWSIRIGLTGKWGEGKSTVLHFIEDLAQADGNVVVWFVPWAATSLDELWAEFANRFLEAVEHAGITVEGLQVAKVKRWGRKVQRNLEPIERLSEAWSPAKAGVGALFALVRRLVRIDGTFLKSLRAQLKDKRVIVLLDDL